MVRSHDKGKAIFTRRIVRVTLKNASGCKGAMGMDIQNILVLQRDFT